MTSATPPTGPLSFQDVLQLVELIQASSRFSELKLRSGGLEIELRRGGAAAPASTVAPVAAPAATPAEKPAEAPALQAMPGAHAVTAPMMGTVYRAPEPGAAPYVQPGQRVEAGQQVCIVEVMKLMNAVHAEHAGVVSQVLVDDGQVVEFGQPLMFITPA